MCDVNTRDVTKMHKIATGCSANKTLILVWIWQNVYTKMCKMCKMCKISKISKIAQNYTKIHTIFNMCFANKTLILWDKFCYFFCYTFLQILHLHKKTKKNFLDFLGLEKSGFYAQLLKILHHAFFENFQIFFTKTRKLPFFAKMTPKIERTEKSAQKVSFFDVRGLYWSLGGGGGAAFFPSFFFIKYEVVISEKKKKIFSPFLVCYSWSM